MSAPWWAKCVLCGCYRLRSLPCRRAVGAVLGAGRIGKIGCVVVWKMMVLFAVSWPLPSVMFPRRTALLPMAPTVPFLPLGQRLKRCCTPSLLPFPLPSPAPAARMRLSLRCPLRTVIAMCATPSWHNVPSGYLRKGTLNEPCKLWHPPLSWLISTSLRSGTLCGSFTLPRWEPCHAVPLMPLRLWYPGTGWRQKCVPVIRERLQVHRAGGPTTCLSSPLILTVSRH